MYVIYLSLEEFIASVAARGVEVRMEVTRRTHRMQGLPTREDHRLTLTAAIDDRVHAVQVLIEPLDCLYGDAVIRQARAQLHTRVTRIQDYLTAYLEERQCPVSSGMLLAPGLRADLEQLEAGQRLWRVPQTDPNDPTTRELVLAATPPWSPAPH